MFTTFDTDKSNALSILELAGMMAKMKIDVTDAELMAIMRHLDTNRSGVIEFEEFQKMIVFDPYK